MDTVETWKPEFVLWALEKSQFGLVVRLSLVRRPNTSPGDEQVLAALLVRSSGDEDGPVAGVVSYRRMLGGGQAYDVSASSVLDEWDRLMGDFTSSWTEHWLHRVNVVCLLSNQTWEGSTADTHEIPVTSVLALQHLARLEGSLNGFAGRCDSANERTIIHAMERRLRGVIINANAERERKVRALM